MIRLTALWLFVGWVVVYAWRDWFKALCGLIMLMAVIEHPDMPKTLLGIQGLNPWNIALLSVTTAWLFSRRREGLKWDLPGWLSLVLFLYVTVIVVSFWRLLRDPGGTDETAAGLISEYFVNTVKWIVPGMLLFDGTRSHERLKLAIFAVCTVYVVLAIQVVRWMWQYVALGGNELQLRALRVLPNEVGYHRVNLSTMFAGAAWGVLAARAVFAKRVSWSVMAYVCAGVIVAGQALTAGRTGYAAWAGLGLVLGALRWRKYLLLAPVAAMLVIAFLPGVSQRLTMGFGDESIDTARPDVDPGEAPTQIGGEQADIYTITSGRNLVWPFVIQKISERPLVGWGRLAMIRTGITEQLRQAFGEGEAVGHPHNAYLEWLLDNGWLGMIIIFPFYFWVVWTSVSLFRDRRAPAFEAVGGLTCAIVGALLIGGLGSQTFYPREGAVPMWCAMGLLMRVSVERARVVRQLKPARRPRPRPGVRAPVAAPATTEPPPTFESLLWAKAS